MLPVGEGLCQCRMCIHDRQDCDDDGWPVEFTQMILCALCGNKRCPHATDHRDNCTSSNDVNQVPTRTVVAAGSAPACGR